MFFNRYRDEGNDYNECVARGNCSIPPEVRALQEVILIYLKQLAFYELKQNELNISYFENKETILEGILSLIATGKYTDEQMLDIISKIYSKMLYSRQEYLNYCTEHKLKCDDLKLSLKLTPQMTLPEIINTGEKTLLSRYKKISSHQLNLYEILVLVLKSIAVNLSKLGEYGKFDDNAYKEVLNGLNLLNYSRTSAEKIKDSIDKLAQIDLTLIDLLDKSQEEKFGEIIKKTVSLSTTPGKALLVSGTNLQTLYEVLEESEDMDFSVYTHSDLLIAHAFTKFRKFKNLKGNYGSCSNSCVLDFATFPGPILLTKSDYPNIDYLYRGKLFSSEKLTPHGVLQIKDSNYSQIFEAALNSKGFSRGRQLEPVEVGYNKDEIIDKISKVCDNIKDGSIERLVIIGMSDNSSSQEEYYKKLSKNLPKNSFIITFSHHTGADNELYINLSGNLPAVYRVLLEIFKSLPVKSEKIYFFFTKCDSNSISNIINLSNLGAKNIFLTQCPPYVINPNILSTLKNIYNIKPATTAEDDSKGIV